MNTTKIAVVSTSGARRILAVDADTLSPLARALAYSITSTIPDDPGGVIRTRCAYTYAERIAAADNQGEIFRLQLIAGPNIKACETATWSAWPSYVGGGPGDYLEQIAGTCLPLGFYPAGGLTTRKTPGLPTLAAARQQVRGYYTGGQIARAYRGAGRALRAGDNTLQPVAEYAVPLYAKDDVERWARESSLGKSFDVVKAGA